MSAAPRPMPEALGRAEAPRSACEILTREPVIASVAVTWRVLRRAIADAAPAGPSRMVELRVTLSGLDGPARASVAVVDPETGAAGEPVAPADARAEVIPDIRGEIHVEAPGWLHATIAPGDAGAWRLVYVRSPLLAVLNIPGGRAEIVGVAVE